MGPGPLLSICAFAGYTLTSPLLAGAMMSPEKWLSSAYIDEINFAAPGAPEKIKAWDQSKDGPLVVHNYPVHKDLAKFKRTKEIKAALAKSAGGLKKPLDMPVKVASQPQFSYWDDGRVWKGKKGKENSATRRIWHKFSTSTMTVKHFFDKFAKEGKPFLYFTGPPGKALPFDPRPDVCKHLTAATSEKKCMEIAKMDETERHLAGFDSIWANSAGVTGIRGRKGEYPCSTDSLTRSGAACRVTGNAHYDRNENVNFQLKGEKLWTLFAPHQLEDICFYPYHGLLQCSTHSA
jgi:hypothetical protein